MNAFIDGMYILALILTLTIMMIAILYEEPD